MDDRERLAQLDREAQQRFDAWAVHCEACAPCQDAGASGQLCGEGRRRILAYVVAERAWRSACGILIVAA